MMHGTINIKNHYSVFCNFAFTLTCSIHCWKNCYATPRLTKWFFHLHFPKKVLLAGDWTFSFNTHILARYVFGLNCSPEVWTSSWRFLSSRVTTCRQINLESPIVSSRNQVATGNKPVQLTHYDDYIGCKGFRRFSFDEWTATFF